MLHSAAGAVCDSDSGKWVAYTLLQFTVLFRQVHGKWVQSVDCGNDLRGVLLTLVTMSSNWIDGWCEMWFKRGCHKLQEYWKENL